MSDLESGLAAIRGRFMTRARNDLAAIEAIDAQGLNADANREALVTIAHKLAGIAGTLGYGEISSAAATLERALLSGSDEQAVAPKIAALQQLLRDLCD